MDGYDRQPPLPHGASTAPSPGRGPQNLWTHQLRSLPPAPLLLQAICRGFERSQDPNLRNHPKLLSSRMCSNVNVPSCPHAATYSLLQGLPDAPKFLTNSLVSMPSQEPRPVFPHRDGGSHHPPCHSTSLGPMTPGWGTGSGLKPENKAKLPCPAQTVGFWISSEFSR